MEIDLKELYSFITIGIVFFIYYFYVRDIFRGRTKPHLYSWIVWALTMGTAAVGVLVGGGASGSWPIFVGTFFVFVIVILSFWYGTTNVTRWDVLSLLFALLAIVLWWQLNDPILAVAMVALIDGIGYIPTYRKTWVSPGSETLMFWALSVIGTGFNILANVEYNFLTMAYLVTIGVLNIGMASVIIFRRKIDTSGSI